MYFSEYLHITQQYKFCYDCMGAAILESVRMHPSISVLPRKTNAPPTESSHRVLPPSPLAESSCRVLLPLQEDFLARLDFYLLINATSGGG